VKDNAEELQKAVEQLHKCRAHFVEMTKVVEISQGKTVWEGTVFVFNIEGHPKATRCYAWSHGLDNSKKRRFFAVLDQGSVDSPQAAVKAAIIKEFRKEKET